MAISTAGTVQPVTSKQDARRLLRARRQALSSAYRADAARSAAAYLLDALRTGLPASVSCFVSMRDEIDTAPLIAGLRKLGCEIALPRQVAFGQPLALHRHEPDDPLVASAFGVLEPLPEAPLLTPRIVIVPLLGFDEHGNRLGYGAGFYDRTLAKLRESEPDVMAVGYAFAAQRLSPLPIEANDQSLDAIATEDGFFRTG